MLFNKFRIKEEYELPIKIISIIFCVIILIIILWYLYYIFKVNVRFKKLIHYFDKNPHFAKETLEISIINKQDNQSNYIFSIGGFIYIIDWKYKYYKNKDFLRKGTNCIHIYLDKEENNLIFKLFSLNTFKIVVIKNVDINRWFHFCIVVQNTNIDLYYNGKLYSSHILNNLVNMNNDNIHICENGGFSGLIYDLKYIEKPYSLKDIYILNNKNPPLNQKYFKIDN